MAPATTGRTARGDSTRIWREVARHIASTFGWMIAALVVIAAIWQAGVKSFGLDSFGVQSVGDVWTYLFTAPMASSNRSGMLDALAITAGHAGAGYATGIVIGTVLAVVCVAIPVLERPLMPIVLLTQALPILAILPLFILMFGRGLTVTIVVTTLAVFFPVFIMVLGAMRRANPAVLDYFASLDAGRTRTLLSLQVPSAVPDFFAAARLGVPASMFGAILAEWLATGNGLGRMMINAAASIGGYAQLWAAVAITTVFTMFCYTIVGIVESLFLGHYAPERLGDD